MKARIIALCLVIAWVVLFLLELRTGTTQQVDLSTAIDGILAKLGLADPTLEPRVAMIVELRLWRATCAGLVGASLALAGALLQGLFRNGLAAPSVLGVTSGATLGAALAILVIGGYGPSLIREAEGQATAPYLITLFAFAGALATTGLVLVLASGRGRVSVPTLLLTGIAINACISGLLATIQSLMLEDYEVSRAMMAWTFGTLDDRKGYHVVMLVTGLTLACAVIPFVGKELDLFAGGEDDAQALGVDIRLTKGLCLAAAALCTACAVAVAGQIAFIGLVVPHLVRLVVGSSHPRVLPLSVLAGAVFLLGTDWVQRFFLDDKQLQPGVMMSLIGGPFFVFLLIKNRRSIEAW